MSTPDASADIIVDQVARRFAAHCSDADVVAAEAGTWPAALWQACEDAGLPLALVDTGDAGADVPVAGAFAIVRLCGAAALPLPLPETMLANWLLARSGLAPQSGPLVLVADPGLAVHADGRLRGEVAAVPWGRAAGIVAAFPQAGALRIAWLGREGVSVHPGSNLAREPRDRIVIDAALADLPQAAALAGLDPLQLRAAGAALRCNQIAGALSRIAELTIAYVGERVQFGRPIAKFQAVQQNVAVLASQAAAATAAADLATDAFAAGIRVDALAAAKTFAGEAAGAACGIAHQMHGAFGFSREYGLQLRTRRAWAWRDEFGNEAEWAARLGATLARGGPDDLWAAIATIE